MVLYVSHNKLGMNTYYSAAEDFWHNVQGVCCNQDLIYFKRIVENILESQSHTRDISSPRHPFNMYAVNHDTAANRLRFETALIDAEWGDSSLLNYMFRENTSNIYKKLTRMMRAYRYYANIIRGASVEDSESESNSE